MKKFWLGLILIFCPLSLYALDVAPEFSGMQFGYGAYDMILAGELHFFRWQFLSVDPFLRFNPFTVTAQWGVEFDYYPLTQFGAGWSIFNDSQVNPFVSAGFGVPLDFASFYFPLGGGLQFHFTDGFGLNLKVYDALFVAPLAKGYPQWDVTIWIKW